MNVRIKIGFIMFLGVVIILATGFLSYRSLSSIITYIHTEQRTDNTMLTIKRISNNLEQAEQGIRIYTTVGEEQYLEPYYNNMVKIDEQIEKLSADKSEDSLYTSIIDTLSYLIDEKFAVWNEILVLYNDYNIDKKLDEITTKIDAVEAQQTADSAKRNFIGRLFNRKKHLENRIDQDEKIIKQIEKLKALQALSNEKRQKKEHQLSETSSLITQRLYEIIDVLEKEEAIKQEQKALEAELLSQETYRWIGSFSVFGTLLALAGLFILTRFLRKTNQYQKALKDAKQKAEELVKAKEIFMANVSHELRTPMNTIAGFTEQLLEQPHLKDEYLEIIKFSSDHLLHLINDLLDYSKLQAGKLKLQPVHFNIHLLVNGVVSIFKVQAKKLGVRLVTNISPAVPEVLFGDDFQLKQIMINLVSNAIKFSKNGEVIISVEAEPLKTYNINLQIRVKDNGIGIAEDKLEYIFEDFTQEDLDTSKKYGGTGLGLSIVKGLIDLHHGNIEVESEKGKGTEFVFTLPYQIGEAEKVVVTTTEHTIPNLKNQKFLVVDDEEYNRKLLTIMLGNWGAEVHEAENGKDALELLDKTAYKAVFMDMRMPVLDGMETANQIRFTLNKTPEELPIYIISAATSEVLVEAENKKIINGFVLKPVKNKMVAKVLKSSSLALPGEPVQAETSAKNNKHTENNLQLLNIEELHSLAGNDKDFIKDMLLKLIEVTDEELLNLETALNDKNWESVANIAHKVASPCRHVGAEELAVVFREIMKRARKQIELSIVPHLVKKAKAMYANLRVEVLNYLDQQ